MKHDEINNPAASRREIHYAYYNYLTTHKPDIKNLTNLLHPRQTRAYESN